MCWALTGGQSRSGFFGDFYIILYLSLARLWFCICFPSNTFSIDKVIIRKSRNTFEKVSKGSWALPQEGPDFRCIHMAPVWCLYMLTDGGSVGSSCSAPAPVMLLALFSINVSFMLLNVTTRLNGTSEVGHRPVHCKPAGTRSTQAVSSRCSHSGCRLGQHEPRKTRALAKETMGSLCKGHAARIWASPSPQFPPLPFQWQRNLPVLLVFNDYCLEGLFPSIFVLSV